MERVWRNRRSWLQCHRSSCFSFRLRFSRSPIPRFLLPILVLLSACGSSSSDPQVIIYPEHGNPIHVSVEIAETPEKRNFGLMYRQELPEFHGMLFLFPHEQPQSFWMKNTPLPLDILFINSALEIVSIAEKTTPFSERPIPSGSPAQFVLEVNGGFCQIHGVKAGDRVELPQDLPQPS
jgi:uncharacterized membrane protein (UPF0127 family)